MIIVDLEEAEKCLENDRAMLIDTSKHDSELLDKVMQKQRTIIDEDGVMYKVVFLKDIEDMKAEVEQ